MTDPEQKLAAKEAERKFVKLRGRLEKSRTEEKKDVLERGRKIDGDAGGFEKRIRTIENRIASEIKAEDDRLEAIRLAEIERNQQRVALIRANIEKIRLTPGRLMHAKATTLFDAIRDLPIVDPTYQEFMAEATEVREEAMRSLTRLMEAAMAREKAETEAAEQKKRADAAEAELAQLRAEKAAREAAAPAPEAVRAEPAAIEPENKAVDFVPLQRPGPRPTPRTLVTSTPSGTDSFVARHLAHQRGADVFAIAGAPSSRLEPGVPYPGDVAMVAAITDRFKIHDELAIRWLQQYPRNS